MPRKSRKIKGIELTDDEYRVFKSFEKAVKKYEKDIQLDSYLEFLEKLQFPKNSTQGWSMPTKIEF